MYNEHTTGNRLTKSVSSSRSKNDKASPLPNCDSARLLGRDTDRERTRLLSPLLSLAATTTTTTTASTTPRANADTAAAFAYREMSENGTSCVPGSTAYGSSATDAEVAWLRRCLPVFVQPDVDISNGNGLVKVFFQFERQDDSGLLYCKLCIIFAGESSYNRINEETTNSCATVMYRTFNRRMYKRTADINYMEFRNVNLDPMAPVPWVSVFSRDHAGVQMWSQGEKKDVGNWFSLMHHYNIDVGIAAWELHAGSQRPLVYLNTCNHLIGERDNNPRMHKFEWVDYPFEEGDFNSAFRYVVDHIPTKCNLYSFVCFWRARNGGGCCDRHHAGKVTRSGGSIYVQHSGVPPTDDIVNVANAKQAI